MEGLALSNARHLAKCQSWFWTHLHHGDGVLPFREVPCCNLRYLHAQPGISILRIVSAVGGS